MDSRYNNFDNGTVERETGGNDRRHSARKRGETANWSSVAGRPTWPRVVWHSSTRAFRSIDTLQLYLIGDLQYTYYVRTDDFEGVRCYKLREYSLGEIIFRPGDRCLWKTGYDSGIRNRVDLHAGSYANYVVMHD